jgi:hypothetical protein
MMKARMLIETVAGSWRDAFGCSRREKGDRFRKDRHMDALKPTMQEGVYGTVFAG